MFLIFTKAKDGKAPRRDECVT